MLKRVRTELRLIDTMGDTAWCKGKVAKKYVKDGCALVDLDIWAENQRCEATTPNGSATVVLPSCDVKTRVFRDGANHDLGYARFA